MDSTSKLFVFMIVMALIVGALVIKFKPHYDLATVYKSNARYYPHINDDTVLKKIQKPKPVDSGTAVDPSIFPGTKSSDTSGKPSKKTKKKSTDNEFVPD